VDCANGVGAGALRKMAEVIGNNCLNVTICNDGSNGILNEKVSNVFLFCNSFTGHMLCSVEQTMSNSTSVLRMVRKHSQPLYGC